MLPAQSGCCAPSSVLRVDRTGLLPIGFAGCNRQRIPTRKVEQRERISRGTDHLQPREFICITGDATHTRIAGDGVQKAVVCRKKQITAVNLRLEQAANALNPEVLFGVIMVVAGIEEIDLGYG